ncbi:MAG: hypothetical protein HZB19_04985 [Chloroflexi bacterium]|nr:hypothetical protein [Chloroflexota bacterium]
MKTRFKFRTVILLAVLLASACAPAVTPSNAPAEAFSPEPATPTATLPPTLAPVETIAAPTALAEVQPIATSRGPDLEATDPTTVSLASGGLQLVEFFRFT